jgi:hypothetical protein
MLWPPDTPLDIMKSYTPATHPHYRRSRYNMKDPHYYSHALASQRTHDIVVSEGMCVYLPARWWHYVESLSDDTISTRFTVDSSYMTMMYDSSSYYDRYEDIGH